MSRLIYRHLLITLAVSSLVGCSKSGDGADARTGGGAGGGAGNNPGSGGKSSSNTGGSGNSPRPGVIGVPVTCSGEVASTLPELADLGAVTARVFGTRARLQVQPYEGAQDYRIYALPADGNVSSANGLVVRDAVYRCAGKSVTASGAPILEIEWPNLQAGTTLVVEALDAGCPYVGHLAASAAPAGQYSRAFVTPQEARDPTTGELFINGQFEPAANRPRPIARAFACLEPATKPAMDFFQDFTSFNETVTTTDVQNSGYQDVYAQTDSFDISFQLIEENAWSFGAVDGQLWVAYADWGADVGAKFRATLRHPVTMSDTTFIHATMAVDAISTHRRYPQLWLSSSPVPVQNNLREGVTLNMETFGGAGQELLLFQICDHRWWDVQEQCPIYYDRDGNGGSANRIEFEERTGVTLPVQFEVYASTRRAYVFYDGQPFRCANLPAGAFTAGQEVKMTIGDVLYHSGADEAIFDSPGPRVYQFHSKYQATETRRVYDDVGLSQGVPEPAWDEDAIPCLDNAYED